MGSSKLKRKICFGLTENLNLDISKHPNHPYHADKATHKCFKEKHFNAMPWSKWLMVTSTIHVA